MNQQKKVAVIGGTGKAGKYLVKQLLLHKYAIKLLHRNPVTLQIANPLIEMVKGDARDGVAIDTLLTGCNAVLSCLGQPIGETTIFSDATKNILQAMEKQHINRYITTAGLNVDTPFDDKSEQTKFGTRWMYENYPKTTADRQVEYEMLAGSDIDWTMVRLPLINQTDNVTNINVSLQDCRGGDISATSLALFMIAQLHDKAYIKQAPFIANQ